jgi:hypothetical protein
VITYLPGVLLQVKHIETAIGTVFVLSLPTGIDTNLDEFGYGINSGLCLVSVGAKFSP